MKLGAQTALWLSEQLLARADVSYLDLVNVSTDKQIKRLDLPAEADDSKRVSDALEWVETHLAPIDAAVGVRVRLYAKGGKYIASKGAADDETALAPLQQTEAMTVPTSPQLTTEERIMAMTERFLGLLERGHDLTERRLDSVVTRQSVMLDQSIAQNQRLSDDLARANNAYTELVSEVLSAKVEEISQAAANVATETSEDAWERVLDKGTSTLKQLYAAHKGVPEQFLDLLAAAATDPEVSAALNDEGFVEQINIDTLRGLARMYRTQQQQEKTA